MKYHLRKIGHYLLIAVALMYLSLAILQSYSSELENTNTLHTTYRDLDENTFEKRSRSKNGNNVAQVLIVSDRVIHSEHSRNLENALFNNSKTDDRQYSFRNAHKGHVNDSQSIAVGHRKLFHEEIEAIDANYYSVNVSDLESLILFPSIILNQRYQCTQNEDVPKGTYLVILIHSHPAHKERRHAIRETWGKIVHDYESSMHVSVLFILGISIRDKDNAKVEHEAKLYRDIIVGNFTDTYQTLSTKSMFALKWAKTYCAEAQFVLKTDDDVYLNVSRLLPMLSQQSHVSTPILMGYRYNQAPVMRDGQWKVDFNQFAADSFPPYCSGVAYVMSSSVLQRLLASYVKLKQLSILQIEDVFTTGVLANASGISCTHNEQFPSWITSPSISNLKRLLQDEMLGIHGVTYTSIYNIHKMIIHCPECSRSHKLLKSYFIKLGKIPLSKE